MSDAERLTALANTLAKNLTAWSERLRRESERGVDTTESSIVIDKICNDIETVNRDVSYELSKRESD